MTPVTITALGALAMAAVISVPAQGQEVNPRGVDPTHFQCYTLAAASTFPFETVRLRDQFSTSTVRVIRPFLLCAPVGKNGEGIDDRRTHLVCYRTSVGDSINKRVRTRNQFGELNLTIGEAGVLCVPSVKQVL